jgi:hypothetical protein
MTGTKDANQKTALGSSSGQDVGFRYNNFFLRYSYVQYRMIRPMISFRTINIDIKCKYLSNFAAVTPRAL